MAIRIADLSRKEQATPWHFFGPFFPLKRPFPVDLGAIFIYFAHVYLRILYRLHIFEGATPWHFFSVFFFEKEQKNKASLSPSWPSIGFLGHIAHRHRLFCHTFVQNLSEKVPSRGTFMPSLSNCPVLQVGEGHSRKPAAWLARCQCFPCTSFLESRDKSNAPVFFATQTLPFRLNPG